MSEISELAADGSSFDEVFCKILPKLYGRAVKLTGAGQWAEDAVHDVYLKLVSRPQRLLEHPEPIAYAFSALSSVARDGWRRDRRQVLLEDMDEGAAVEAYGGSQAWDGGVERRTAEIEAVRLLRQLPRQQASVVILVDLDGHTIDQAARVMDIHRGTAARYRTRALRKLRDLLKSSASTSHSRILCGAFT
ncbi:RNA polymerase sigma factor [Streptomyces sp. 8N616]|uniref:RNA polymerase sigma factor n=1 Tax=Streptomyces sp. 8N616 TaxID=3457414 RepID=UPI003FD0B41D